MFSVMQTALRAIQSHECGLAVVANNLANVNTAGYRAQRYDPGSGQVRPRHGEIERRPQQATPPPSDVDLAEELVALKRYELGVRANARVVEVADDTLGRLLDVFAGDDS